MAPIPVRISEFGKVASFSINLDPARTTERVIAEWFSLKKLYEADVTCAVMRVLNPGDLVADVGAHVGYFTLISASLVGPSGRVVAFEPNADNFQRLNANIEASGFTQVTPINKVVTADGAPTTFFTNVDNDGGHALWNPGLHHKNVESGEKTISQTVDTVTLAGALADCVGARPPKLIKIDTEGAEYMVLKGAGNLLGPNGTPFIITELHNPGLAHLGSSQLQLREMMADAGYETFLLPMSGAVPKLVPRKVEIRCRYFLNVLFASPDRLAEYWPYLDIEDPNLIS